MAYYQKSLDSKPVKLELEDISQQLCLVSEQKTKLVPLRHCKITKNQSKGWTSLVLQDTVRDLDDFSHFPKDSQATYKLSFQTDEDAVAWQNQIEKSLKFLQNVQDSLVIY